MRPVIILFIILSIPTVGFSGTINVPDDYPTIQQAIDASLDGDTILVKDGLYPENINFKGRAITVESQNGPDFTTIYGSLSGSVVTFDSAEGNDTILKGFTITGGINSAGGGVECYSSNPTIKNNRICENIASANGGGIRCYHSEAIIVNNEIFSNEAVLGGGIQCVSSSPEIRNNRIFDNTATSAGGGICSGGGSPVIRNNKIHDNTSYEGGGIRCSSDSTAIVKNNIVRHNTAYFGAGLCIYDDYSTISDNTFFQNTSLYYGGGIYCSSTYSTITKNSICKNEATQDGGGIACLSSSVNISMNAIYQNITSSDGGGIFLRYSDSANTITDNTIFENESSERGGGLSCREDVSIITNNTIYGNFADVDGGGIACFEASTSAVTNNIFWSDYSTGYNEIYVDAASSPSITYCCVQGGYPGAGNISTSPDFVDAANWDFHILYTSNCRDSGTNLAPGLPETDFEDDPRIAYGTVDIGADEFYPHLYYVNDLKPIGNVELILVGLPETSPVFLFIGYHVLEPPVKTKWSDWHLQLPILGGFDLGKIPSPEGILIIKDQNNSVLPPPSSIPIQALIGTELTNLLCMQVQ